jgi:DNA-binding NarL/FixJ family response regulator
VARDPGPDGRTGPARLVLADDHDLVREGLHLVLSREPDLEVVGEASDGREAVEVCRKLKPDLVLMDVRMPEMDGLEATREIKREQPSVSVLVVTTYENPDYLLEALKAGAAGYVLKDAPKGQLVNAMRRVLSGESPLNQELAARLIQRLASESPLPGRLSHPSGSPEQPKRAVPIPSGLTPRELEVLGFLAQGKSNPDIAGTLSISRATVKVHVERIIRKLGVSDRTQAVVRAIEMGLILPKIGRG